MESEPQKKTRRAPNDLIPLIFSVLPVQGLKTKTGIAHEIGTKPDTVDDYLDLIMYVQQQPLVEQVKVGTRRYGYRRARAKKEAP